MPFLKQSTSQVVRFGPCLDMTDGVTEETALTLAQADMRLSKDGGAFAQKNAAGNATHDSDGWYSTTLDATDTNTVGELVLNVHQPANMLPVWLRWWVIEEAIYDALFGAAAAGFDANQRVDVGSWIGTAVTLGSGAPDVNVQSQDNIGLTAQQKLDVNIEADTAATDYDAAIPADLGTPQKNQAFSNIEFLLVDSTDHVTPETGLSPTGQRSIDGGAFVAVSGTIAEVGNGIYQFDALAADMNGDTIMFRFSDAAADDTFVFIRTRA